MHIKARYEKMGGHYHVTFFVAQNTKATFANMGALVMTEEDFNSFRDYGVNEWYEVKWVEHGKI